MASSAYVAQSFPAPVVVINQGKGAYVVSTIVVIDPAPAPPSQAVQILMPSPGLRQM
jgi:hypothetical protein